MKNVTHLHNRRIDNNLVVGVVMVHKGGFYEIWHWVSEEVRWNISYNQGPINLFWVFPRQELGKKTIEPLSPEPAHPSDNLEDKLIWWLSLRIHWIKSNGLKSIHPWTSHETSGMTWFIYLCTGWTNGLHSMPLNIQTKLFTATSLSQSPTPLHKCSWKAYDQKAREAGAWWKILGDGSQTQLRRVQLIPVSYI
jgi:hypothetical protein